METARLKNNRIFDMSVETNLGTVIPLIQDLDTDKLRECIKFINDSLLDHYFETNILTDNELSNLLENLRVLQSEYLNRIMYSSF